MATDELGTSVSAQDQAAASEPKKPTVEPEDKGVAADTASGTTSPAEPQATVAAPRHAAQDDTDSGGRVDTKAAESATPAKPDSARGAGLHNR